MRTAADDIAPYGFALAALAYGALAIYLLVARRLVTAQARARHGFMAALASSAVWAAAQLAAALWPLQPLGGPASVLDLARYGCWFWFVLALLPANAQAPASRSPLGLRITAGVALALALLLQVADEWARSWPRAAMASALVLAVFGLLLVEQLFRNLAADSHWNAKPVCLGLCCVFGFDVYLYAEGLTLASFDADAFGLRGAVHALAVPFLYIAARRRANWIAKLQVSRRAAFYSVTLILAGAYLLFMAGVGYYVKFFGGDWGRALQQGLVVIGVVALAMMIFSGALRSRLRVFVGKHFYSYRYDYRDEWLKFTAMLYSKRSPQETGEMIVRGLARMVECPAGSLWMRHGLDGSHAQIARWNMPPVAEAEPAESSLCQFMKHSGWVIDLDEFRASPRRYAELAMPTWLLATPNAWLVVPLMVDDELLGFVLLARPLAPMKVNWEVLDLLKTAGRQAAGHLAQMQATEALLEARKFEAFNRMSAFVVHDLKNIVAQLSLMLKNAERLHSNREFQKDMLLTVESSLEKMRRLMLQLREGATPPGGSRGVELEPIMLRLEALAAAQGRRLEHCGAERLSTRGHADRLERVLGHLVQNALDATPADGRVWITCARQSGQVAVVVGDTGAGMSEEFVREKLFRPFHSTKHSGMGIGTYESLQYINELGGSLTAASRIGEGTTFTMLLPVFEAHQGFDLAGAAGR